MLARSFHAQVSNAMAVAVNQEKRGGFEFAAKKHKRRIFLRFLEETAATRHLAFNPLSVRGGEETCYRPVFPFAYLAWFAV
jgi:hypothetical protein